MSRNPQVADYDVITISTSADDILALGALSTYPTGMKSFVGVLETAAVRARGDGTSPSASEGVLINPGDTVYLSETEIRETEFIRDGSTDGVLRGHYYKAEVTDLLGR